MLANINPVLVEVTRGSMVESRHRGAACVYDATGARVIAWGDVEAAVFPRSAIKIVQALPFLETGAADVCGASFQEIALACASHGGEPSHIETAASWMDRLGLEESHFACGPHQPLDPAAAAGLAREGRSPSPLHNNCSGKHLAMMATALAKNEPVAGYHEPTHPVQRRIRESIAEMTGENLADAPRAIDGCSVPTYALSLAGLARAMARIADPTGLRIARQSAIRRLRTAVSRNPIHVAGSGRFCTAFIAQKGAGLYVKTGAEGVFCAAVPDMGIGLALKIDDGAKRASEVALAAILRYLEVLDDADWEALAAFCAPPLINAAGIVVGEIRTISGWPHGRIVQD